MRRCCSIHTLRILDHHLFYSCTEPGHRPGIPGSVSRARPFPGSVVPGFGHSRDRSFPGSVFPGFDRSRYQNVRLSRSFTLVDSTQLSSLPYFGPITYSTGQFIQWSPLLPRTLNKYASFVCQALKIDLKMTELHLRRTSTSSNSAANISSNVLSKTCPGNMVQIVWAETRCFERCINI